MTVRGPSQKYKIGRSSKLCQLPTWKKLSLRTRDLSFSSPKASNGEKKDVFIPMNLARLLGAAYVLFPHAISLTFCSSWPPTFTRKGWFFA